MMAYRASEHETTGFSPNILMLGRETATPLDLIYKMPSSIRSIPANIWVWELKERLEAAHALVRTYSACSEGSIMRQKTYHDHKMSWERFKEGDLVYVYFPQKKKGTSPKFTSFWRGPFEVSKRVSEVLYEVNCGQNGHMQIIHCDRLKKKVTQLLKGEDVDQVEYDNIHKEEVLVSENVEDVDKPPQQIQSKTRVIKRPK